MAKRDTSPFYRFVLVIFGCVFAFSGGTLAIAYRSVPLRDLWAVVLASSYGLIFSCAIPSSRALYDYSSVETEVSTLSDTPNMSNGRPASAVGVNGNDRDGEAADGSGGDVSDDDPRGGDGADEDFRSDIDSTEVRSEVDTSRANGGTNGNVNGSAAKKTVRRVLPLAQDGKMRVQAIALLLLSLVISIVLPWLWILFGDPSRSQLDMLIPPLFVLSTQVMFELACYRPRISMLLRVSVPVFFVAYRLRLLVHWVEAAADAVVQAGPNVPNDTYLMLALASLNLAFWVFVLFYFLLLRIVPRYFLRRDTALQKSGMGVAIETNANTANLR